MHGLSHYCNAVLDQRNAENKSLVDTLAILPFFLLILASKRNECRPRNLMRNIVIFRTHYITLVHV